MLYTGGLTGGVAAGVAAGAMAGLNALYLALTAFVLISAGLALKRAIPKRHKS